MAENQDFGNNVHRGEDKVNGKDADNINKTLPHMFHNCQSSSFQMELTQPQLIC
jgi:hypothetical protein